MIKRVKMLSQSDNQLESCHCYLSQRIYTEEIKTSAAAARAASPARTHFLANAHGDKVKAQHNNNNNIQITTIIYK